ncbi:drug/metabolite exporter YedA [Nannocystis sp.]|uniref:drug/metabolite exporter YedA n=1 Tax=Nannocystis sp. TaxID=1962667 RepID=UPI0025FEBAE9|nr:drug/metabolite exporter YedA [Nannocystis sp.]MBK7830633.1 drug/metabolite exporter YedA [Nannocystis sp.]
MDHDCPAPASPALPRARPPLLLVAALLTVYLLWGSTYLAIRIALETVPPFALGAVRFLIAGGGLYLVLRLRGAPAPSPREWRTAAITGVLLFVGGNGFVVLGEQWVSSGLVALVVGTMPLWAAVFAGIGGQRSSAREWLGLALGFLGISVLSLGGELHAAGIGALLVVLAPVCWALGVVLGRRGPLPAGGMAAASQMLAASVVLLGLSLGFGEPLLAVPSTRSLLAVAYLIVFGSLVGFTAYAYLLRNARTAVANSYAYVNPIVAIVLGAALAGEAVGPSTWLAAAIILSGLAVLARPRKPQDPTR